MIDNPIVQQALFFGLNFASILVSLLFYAIFFWVIASWLVLFGILRPDNRLFSFLTQLVYPIIKPFRWANLGGIDFSPIIAIMLLNFAMEALHAGVVQLVG